MADRPGLYRGIRLGDSARAGRRGRGLVRRGGRRGGGEAREAGRRPVGQRRGLREPARHEPRGRAARGRRRRRHPAPGHRPGDRRQLHRGDPGRRRRRCSRGAVWPRSSRVAVPTPTRSPSPDDWLAVRRRPGRRDRLAGPRRSRPTARSGNRGRWRRAAERAQIGRPSIGGDRIAYAVASPSQEQARRSTGPAPASATPILRSRKAGLSNPSLYGQAMLYVRTERGHDELRLRKLRSAAAATAACAPATRGCGRPRSARSAPT